MRNPLRTSHANCRGKIIEGVWPDVEEVYNPNTGHMRIDYNYRDLESQWTHLGFAPRPRTRVEWFWSDIHHGHLMRYPRFAVWTWAIRAWFRYGGPSCTRRIDHDV